MAPERGCGRSHTRAPNSSCRWPTSRFFFYGIEAIRQAGITDIGIIVGDTAGEIRAAVGDGSRWDARITYIPQEAPLGLAHAVLTAEPFLADDPFVMYLGDNILANGIAGLVAEFRQEQPTAQVLLAHVPHPEQFGVAELEDGRVTRLQEKPSAPRSDLALVGVYMFRASVFEAARAIRPSARNELEITDAIQYLIRQGLHRAASHRRRLVEGHREAGRHTGSQPGWSWTRSIRGWMDASMPTRAWRARW